MENAKKWITTPLDFKIFKNVSGQAELGRGGGIMVSARLGIELSKIEPYSMSLCCVLRQAGV